MNRKLYLTLAHCAVLVLACITFPAFAEEIKGDEIVSIINGKTLSGYNVNENKSVTLYFSQDNTMKFKKKNNTWPGTWRIDDLGRLCFQLRDPYSDALQKEQCKVLAKESGKLVMYGQNKEGVRTGDTLSFENIADGNTENL